MDSAIIAVSRINDIQFNYVDMVHLSVRLDAERMLNGLAFNKAAFMNNNRKFNF